MLVLDSRDGERPSLGFPGCWLYSGGTATVHLMGPRTPREGIVVRGTEKKYDDTGRADHIAFAASDVEGMRRRLQSKNIKFRESIVPHTGDTQFFLYDPDGGGVELNFPRSRRRSERYASFFPPIPTRSYGRHISGMKRSAFPQFCMTI